MRVMLRSVRHDPCGALETAPQTAQQALPAGFVLDTDYEPAAIPIAAGHRARRGPVSPSRAASFATATTR